MEWLTIIGLIAVGIFLVVAEIIFIPGIFIAGTAGVLLSIWGVYLSFESYGSTVGVIVLISTVVANISAVFFTLRGKTWEKFSLHDEHTAKVNEHRTESIQIGDRGMTVSVLKPIGKAIFNDQVIEVSTKGSYIEEKSEIEVINISSNKIIVEKVKQH